MESQQQAENKENKTIEKFFEPAELKTNYASEEDYKIIEADFPERLYIKYQNYEELKPEEKEQEIE